jgi:dipeptidyl aminopeptidase/acylaminoacyl peptidase
MRNVLASLAVAVGLSAPSFADIESRPIPADAFAKVPNIASVSMSPDGATIVAIVADPNSDNEQTALATWDMTDEDMPVVITPSGRRMAFTNAFALSADRLIAIARQEYVGRVGACGFEGASTGSTETHVFKTYLTDAEHSDFEDAFESNSRSIGMSDAMQRCLEIAGSAGLTSQLPLDPEHVLINRASGASLRGRYYRYNLETGATELWPLETPGGLAYLDEATGEALAGQTVEPEGGDFRIDYHLRHPDTGEFEVHEELSSLASTRFTVAINGHNPDTGEFYIVTDKFSNYAAVYTYDPRTRTFGDQPLVAHPDFSINGLLFSDKPSNYGEIIGYSVSADVNTVEWVDPNLAQIQQLLDANFQEGGVNLMDWTDDYQRVLFSVGAGNKPSSYYVLDNLNRVRLLGHSRPWLDDYPMDEPELVYYTARDGMEIPAILTLPAGWTPEDGPLPTIVLPHGGPWVRDFANWDFSGWVQFFATRGHAVLQPNYRGSAGMGRELWLAGDAEWGQAMQDDKDDGAAWLVEQGIAHPDQIAIFGYSYGGFAAMAATVRQDGPYQCAIAGAGVSNLGRLGNTWSDNPLQRIVQGVTVRGMDPIEEVDQANLPILLFHGSHDVRVPLFHSTDFYNAVRDRVYAEYHVLDGMGHQGDRWYPEHTQESFALMERFLQEQCGPGGLYN